MLFGLSLVFCAYLVHSACVDLSVKGYYTPGKIFHDGLPPDSFSRSYVKLANSLSYCELEEVSQYCVDRINSYRAGTLKFTDGSTDPGIPRVALQHAKAYASCSSSQALGDLAGSTGGCNNAHKNAFSCPSSGGSGQNSCCFRNGMTLTDIKNQLNGCLQQMWDEGIGMLDNAGFSEANGHWINMRNAGSKYASCGFGFSSDGGLWMNQDFFSSGSASLSACSCTIASASDGCGGICVNADGSILGSGAGGTGPFSIAAVVLAFVVALLLLGLLFLYLKRGKASPLEGLGEKAGVIHLVLQFVLFVLGAVALGGPWGSGNGITLSLWEVCVPTSTDPVCNTASTASSGSQGIFAAVQAFAVLGMLLALFSFVGYVVLRRCTAKLAAKKPTLLKALVGTAILDFVIFFLSICFFGGFFLDEGNDLSMEWGCGIEILCWVLSAVCVLFALRDIQSTAGSSPPG